jgi:Protein of unknown function (DUF429)
VVKLLQAASGVPIVGIDVGEDSLDLAIVDAAAKHLRLERVAVVGIERGGDANSGEPSGGDPNREQTNIDGTIRGDGREGCGIDELRRRILAAAPELGASGAIALVDSPRWPRDLDLGEGGGNLREVFVRAVLGASAGRKIDTTLRAMVGRLGLRKAGGAPFSLALFPTPRLEYFAACARDPRCKPHLAALGRELFPDAIEKASPGIAPVGGRVFTRFMLTGFAAYRAIDGIGVDSYEAYPDLAFRCWAGGAEIPPKSAGRSALVARMRINGRLAEEIGCEGASRIATLDEADAAVLALSAVKARRSGAIALIEEAGEGRFALAIDCDQAERIGLGRRLIR